MSEKLLVAAMLFLCTYTAHLFGYDMRNPLYFDVFPGFEPAVLLAATGVGYLLSESEAAGSAHRNPENSWFGYGMIGFYPSYENSGESVLDSRVGFGRYILPWFALGAEINWSAETDDRTRTTGMGWLAYFRWRARGSKILAFFFDYGFGMMVSMEAFPSGGTVRNFMPTYGIGISILAAPRHSLFCGMRHFHLSNNQKENNPGFNSDGFFCGYEYSFGR